MLFRRTLFDNVPVRRPEFSLRDDRMMMLEVGLLNPKIARSPGVAGYWSKHKSQMHDNYHGTKIIVAHWQMLGIFRYILKVLIDRNELTCRRANAASNSLWPLAHQLSVTSLSEGAAVASWIYEINPYFRPPNRGILGWCYRRLGFQLTERLLHLRRLVMQIFREQQPKTSLCLPSPKS